MLPVLFFWVSQKSFSIFTKPENPCREKSGFPLEPALMKMGAGMTMRLFPNGLWCLASWLFLRFNKHSYLTSLEAQFDSAGNSKSKICFKNRRQKPANFRLRAGKRRVAAFDFDSLWRHGWISAKTVMVHEKNVCARRIPCCQF